MLQVLMGCDFAYATCAKSPELKSESFTSFGIVMYSSDTDTVQNALEVKIQLY